MFLLVLSVVTTYCRVTAQGDSSNILYSSRGYYGGFEAGSSNICSKGGGTDYQYTLPRMGSFAIVRNAGELKNNKVIHKSPHSGKYFMVSHVSNFANRNIWWKKLAVQPGEIYYFGAFVALLSKNNNPGVRIQLKINDSVISSAPVSEQWNSLQGHFIVPPNVNLIAINISCKNVMQQGNYIGVDDIYFSKNPMVVEPKAITPAVNSESKIVATKALKRSSLGSRVPTAATARSLSGNVKKPFSRKHEISIYPNPARDYFVININSFVFGQAYVQIINDAGKIVFSRDAHVSVGLNAITISNRSLLSGGTYKVQVKSGQDVCNHDLVVL